MATGRRLIIVIGLVTIALVGLGVWRRTTLTNEREVARAERRIALARLAQTRKSLVGATLRAGAIEHATAEVRATTTELVRIADDLTVQIRTLEKSRDDAAIAAWVAGGQVGQMRECLGGINRALNQVSVGDPKSVSTLAGVRSSCRAVGA
ncbi:MAG: hypothetical protein ABIP21_08385 [Acidimicrobiia bacterium]